MTDADIIDRAGGPSALAQQLRLVDKGAVQRVSNWKRRGIPARIWLDHQAVFEALQTPPPAPELVGTRTRGDP